MYEKLKTKFTNHIFISWSIISLLFALIIHILFQLDGPSWLTATWSSGDILTYASTVALGLLAIWQNHVIQRENDKSQSKLEELNNRAVALSEKANELNVITQIIRIEDQRLHNLRLLGNDFLELCMPEYILNSVQQVSYGASVKKHTIGELKARINIAHAKFAEEFRWDTNVTNDNENHVRPCAKAIQDGAYEIYDALSVNSDNNFRIQELLEGQSKKCNEFLLEKSNYLKNEEERLREVLYSNLSLEQIKEKYHRYS